MRHSDSYQLHQSTQVLPTILYSRKYLFLQKIKKIIDINMDNEEFCVATLAKKAHLSTSQLNRKLKSLNSEPAGQLIRIQRMNYAAQLLANDVATIGEIADRVGYPTHANFCRSFKRQFGCSPSQYSKKNMSGTTSA